MPAYFGQHDKFYFNGNYYDLSASHVDRLAPADAVKANQSIKEKYPNAKLNKDKVTTIVLQEASGDKPYTAIHAKAMTTSVLVRRCITMPTKPQHAAILCKAVGPMPAPRCPVQVNSPIMVFGRAILPKKGQRL